MRKADDLDIDLTPDQITARDRRKKFGGFNDYPPNWKPCNEDEFWKKFFLYGTGKTESRQMNKPKAVHAGMFLRSEPVMAGTMTEATLMIHDDGTGLALVQNYDRSIRAMRSPKLFKFAVCEHQWGMIRSKRQHGSTIRTQQCSKCGETVTLDSSD